LEKGRKVICPMEIDDTLNNFLVELVEKEIE